MKQDLQSQNNSERIKNKNNEISSDASRKEKLSSYDLCRCIIASVNYDYMYQIKMLKYRGLDENGKDDGLGLWELNWKEIEKLKNTFGGKITIFNSMPSILHDQLIRKIFEYLFEVEYKKAILKRPFINLGGLMDRRVKIEQSTSDISQFYNSYDSLEDVIKNVYSTFNHVKEMLNISDESLMKMTEAFDDMPLDSYCHAIIKIAILYSSGSKSFAKEWEKLISTDALIDEQLQKPLREIAPSLIYSIIFETNMYNELPKERKGYYQRCLSQLNDTQKRIFVDRCGDYLINSIRDIFQDYEYHLEIYDVFKDGCQKTFKSINRIKSQDFVRSDLMLVSKREYQNLLYQLQTQDKYVEVPKTRYLSKSKVLEKIKDRWETNE